MSNLAKTVEAKREQLKKQLRELTKFEDEVLEAVNSLSLNTLSINADVAVEEIRAPRIQGYDQRIFFRGKIIPNHLKEAGGSRYYWGQFECPVEYLTTQQISHYHALIADLREKLEKAIADL